MQTTSDIDSKGRPRTMTPALLAEIARLLNVSARTARLYVQRAREVGLLGGSIPGRAGEAKST